MRALVVGYGSIGSRHARILTELGCEVGVLSQRSVSGVRLYRQMGNALSDLCPEYVVIANTTSQHYLALSELKEAGFHGVVLVEKPLFARNEVFDGGGFRKVLVGYNLRFHPLIKRLRELLGEEIVYSVQVYVGKNLAEWRPGSDYRKSYSAIQDQGGGVLRDLSHELDYLNWLLGGWKSVTAVGGHFSELEIETDDVFCLLMSMEACSVVQIQMNYLDMVGHRQIWINGKSGMIKADLMEGSLEINGHREEYKVERDFTYRAEHLAVLSQDFGTICSYEEGFEIIRLIESAERASKERIWVAR